MSNLDCPRWTQEADARLLELSKLRLTAAGIAAELNAVPGAPLVTRSAVIARLRRMKITLPKKLAGACDHQGKRARQARSAAKAKPQTAISRFASRAWDEKSAAIEPAMPSSVPIEHLPDVHTGAAAAILALRPNDCRFPLGNPQDEDFRFCTAPRWRETSSYCSAHARIAWRAR